MCFSTFELPKAKYVAAFLQAINLFINVVAAFWYRKDILKDPQNLTIIAVVVMSMFMACFLLAIAKILFFFEDKRSQTCENYLNSQQKCRRDLIFGYGYIALFGYIPLVVGFVLGNSLKSLTGSFICNITCAIAYYLFILQHLKTYQLCSPPLIPFIRYFQVLWLPCNFFAITAVLVIISTNSTLAQCLSNIGFIIHYFIFFTIPMREFITVTMNGVWLPGQELVEMITMDNIPTTFHQGDEDRMSQDGPHCPICLEEYSGSRVPRVLNMCGHEFCESCILRMVGLEEDGGLVCPYCRIPSVLPDSCMVLRDD